MNWLWHSGIRRRLMLALSVLTLVLSAAFGVLSMGFAYTVEDRFLERQLAEEAVRQWQALARTGQWAAPLRESMRVYAQSDNMPADLAEALAANARGREFSGQQGRHYHLLPLAAAGGPPWLVAEVGAELVVRPMRGGLWQWLVGWGVALSLLALALAAWLARLIGAPLEQLGAEVDAREPGHPPAASALAERDDEIGLLARRFDALQTRTQGLIEREQAFSRDASHELRTPLTVIGLAVTDLLQRQPPGAPESAPLRAMQAAVQLMQQTVESLLLLAREVAVEPGPPVPLLPLIERWVLAHAAALDARGLQLDLRVGPEHRVALPGEVLSLVLHNLLGNALRHAPMGAQIRVECPAGGLRIGNAAGAPSGDSGLGWPIVRRLLARHGAQLQVEADAGWLAVELVLTKSSQPAD